MPFKSISFALMRDKIAPLVSTVALFPGLLLFFLTLSAGYPGPIPFWVVQLHPVWLAMMFLLPYFLCPCTHERKGILYSSGSAGAFLGTLLGTLLWLFLVFWMHGTIHFPSDWRYVRTVQIFLALTYLFVIPLLTFYFSAWACERAERKSKGYWDFRESLDIMAPAGSATGAILGATVALTIAHEYLGVTDITSPVIVLLIGVFTYSFCTCTHQQTEVREISVVTAIVAMIGYLLATTVSGAYTYTVWFEHVFIYFLCFLCPPFFTTLALCEWRRKRTPKPLP
ncbi:MAG: hypothetical protein N3F63_06735 [Thermoplasmata archaeon]|nr:hypothetical protein [Thermoplasmata archaeon]